MDEKPYLYQPRRENAPPRRRRQDFRKNLQKLLAVVFLLALAATLGVNLLTPEREFSENENRLLASRPALTWDSVKDGSFMAALGDWQADQFFARDKWIALNLKWNTLLGRSEANGVYLCDNGYLIAAPETPDEAALQNTREAMQAFSARHPDVTVRAMIVPGAAASLGEFLPENAPVRDQQRDIDAALAPLSGSLQIVDVSETLRANALQGTYYRTDHHWTSFGAYCAFLSAAPELGIAQPVSYAPHTVSVSFEGTLASRSGSHAVKDRIDVYEPLDPGSEFMVTYNATLEKSRSLFVSEMLEEKDQYTLFFGGNHPRLTVRTTAQTGRVLLVFKDSYANAFIQFLTPYYDQIILIDPRYYYDDVNALMKSEGVTEVLYLYSADTFLTDKSLADTLNVGG